MQHNRILPIWTWPVRFSQYVKATNHHKNIHDRMLTWPESPQAQFPGCCL